MREIPLDDQAEAFQFGERLLAGTIDLLILLTGVGTRTLVRALSRKYEQAEVLQALGTILLLVRGPKPIVALAELGLEPTITVPEPNTWRDILTTLDARGPITGWRVAVQEYGVSNEALLDGLRARGAEVIRVGVYRWALPEDMGPLRQAVQAVCAKQADVLLFMSATQLEHVLLTAKAMGLEDPFRVAAQRCVIASIGPVCTEALTAHKFVVDMEPAHPRMGLLLSEASRKSHTLLAAKRAPSRM
jgi:uroporphyrinogen-III synthase